MTAAKIILESILALIGILLDDSDDDAKRTAAQQRYTDATLALVSLPDRQAARQAELDEAVPRP